MTQSSTGSNSIAPLRNVMNFMTMVERLIARGTGLPGMGCFYGPAGFGKTWSTIYAANSGPMCVVQVKSVWSQKALCINILKELGIKPKKVVWEMVDQISAELAKSGKTLVIDEADHLVRKRMIEVVRDIYESSFVPVILVGEEALPSTLRQWERINSRMLERVAAEPIDAMDFDHLAKLRCPHLDLDPEIAVQIQDASRGSARLICNNLDTLELEVRTRGVSGQITAANIGEIEWHTGIAPDMRRFA